MEKDIALKFIDFKGAHNGLRRFYVHIYSKAIHY